MQGKQRYIQALFVSLDLDQFIPVDHRLRSIDRILDFSFIRPLTKNLYCQRDGRPSIDPVVFFKMQVIKYLYGISSDRQLCADIHVNLAYRWFLRLPIEEKVPDHSSLTKIRDRLGEDMPLAGRKRPLPLYQTSSASSRFWIGICFRGTNQK